MFNLINPLLKIFLLTFLFISGSPLLAYTASTAQMEVLSNKSISGKSFISTITTTATTTFLGYAVSKNVSCPNLTGYTFFLENILGGHPYPTFRPFYNYTPDYEVATNFPNPNTYDSAFNNNVCFVNIGSIPAGTYYIGGGFANSSTANYFYGSAGSGADYMTNTGVPSIDNSVGDYSFFLTNDRFANDILLEDRTRIIELTPENNFIATSTGTTTDIIYNFTYYINQNDIGQKFSVQVFLKNYDQNTLFGGLSDSQIEFLDFTATSSGVGGISGYITVPDGNYMIKAQLKKSLWGFTLPKIGVLDERENQFIVGSSTYIGALVQGSRNSLNNALSSTSAMSFASSSNTCNPFSGSVSTLYFNVDFSPIACTAFLFVPDQTLISDSLTNVRINVLQAFPIGYITDFVTIMATTSTSTLTVINATLPSILPGGGAKIKLDLSHALDWALYATSSKYNNASASSTRTLFDITNDYWKIIVYVSALLYILSRLLGTRLIPSNFIGHNKTTKI